MSTEGTGAQEVGEVPGVERSPGPVPAVDPAPRRATTADDTAGEHEAIMARFTRDYLELLDHRLESIRHHLDSGNFLTAHVALLSLESTSVMVGAPGLADAAGRLRTAVQQGDRSGTDELVAAMAHEAERTRAALRPGV